MSKSTTNQMKCNDLKSHELTEKSDTNSNEMIESFVNSKQLQTISENWIEFIEQISINCLNTKFDILSQTIEQNNDLLEKIDSKHEMELKNIISESNLKINNKTSIDLTANDLINESIESKSCVQSLSSELIEKKQHKTELTDKTKALTKQLERMENRVKELKRENHCNDNTEYLTLASVMRVMYKTWNNSKVIGLLFNDNEEKSLERLIVIDRENKCEQQMAQQFWDSLNKDYDI